MSDHGFYRGTTCTAIPNQAHKVTEKRNEIRKELKASAKELELFGELPGRWFFPSPTAEPQFLERHETLSNWLHLVYHFLAHGGTVLMTYTNSPSSLVPTLRPTVQVTKAVRANLDIDPERWSQAQTYRYLSVVGWNTDDLIRPRDIWLTDPHDALFQMTPSYDIPSYMKAKKGLKFCFLEEEDIYDGSTKDDRMWWSVEGLVFTCVAPLGYFLKFGYAKESELLGHMSLRFPESDTPLEIQATIEKLHTMLTVRQCEDPSQARNENVTAPQDNEEPPLIEQWFSHHHVQQVSPFN